MRDIGDIPGRRVEIQQVRDEERNPEDDKWNERDSGVDRAVGRCHQPGAHQPGDSAGGTDRKLIREEEAEGDTAGDHGRSVEQQHPGRTEYGFTSPAKEVQEQHIVEQMDNAIVDEGCGEQDLRSSPDHGVQAEGICLDDRLLLPG